MHKKTRMQKSVAGPTLLEAGAGPLTVTERAHFILERFEKYRKTLFAEFIAECRRDPQFLDDALKELKPLRGRGSQRAPPWRDAMVEGVMSALHGRRPGEIIEQLSISLGVSDDHARRLYYAARKHRK